jgi:hypothetical protein
MKYIHYLLSIMLILSLNACGDDSGDPPESHVRENGPIKHVPKEPIKEDRKTIIEITLEHSNSIQHQNLSNESHNSVFKFCKFCKMSVKNTPLKEKLLL